MNERREVPLGPMPKLETIVSEAVEIVKTQDSARAVAYIVENTHPDEDRESIMSAFAATLGPRMKIPTPEQRRHDKLARDPRRLTAALGSRAVRHT